MKKFLINTFFIFFAATVIFTSCENDEVTVNPDKKSIQESTMTESAVNDVVGLVNSGSNNKNANENSCGSFIFDAIDNSLIITFPETGCTGEDGITRSGTINVQYTGTWQESGAKAIITFNGYKRDGVELSGSITMSFTASETQASINITAANMILTFEDGSTISWTGSSTYTYYGLNTPLDLTDDYFEINGASSGTTKEGKSFAMVASNLQTSASCKWFVSGNLKTTITDTDKTSVYDLSFKETCGTVDGTYNGIPFTINLDE